LFPIANAMPVLEHGVMETNETPTMDPPTMEHPGSLERPLAGRMLAGVAAGVAEYLDVDVTLVRIAFAVTGLLGGIGLPLYVAAWLLVPEEGSPESVADEMLARIRVP
jgi:phage shock protein C